MNSSCDDPKIRLCFGPVLELRHLRTLREVARAGSYSGAARELGYTQPAVSQQMRALETAVGTSLVMRAGRRVRLTEAGAALARHSATILGSVAAAEEEAATIAGLRAGHVRVSAFPSASAALVPAAISSVVRRHEGVRVSLVEQEPPESMQALRAGDSDLALVFTYEGSDEDSGDDLFQLPLLEDPLLAVVATGHRLAKRKWIGIDALAEERWIAGCPRCRRNLVRVCRAAGYEPDIAFATDDNVAAQSLVAADLGVALMPRLVLDAVQRAGIVAKPLRPAVSRSIMAVTWPEARHVPGAAAMLRALSEAVPGSQSTPLRTAK
jgi:DNA-binding transcriptional LysR family regulator